ncbi:hypothetical protein ELH38_38260 [Rhizobium ruizarguesonis]|nr:hypothetical protein ELH38_38260 [Rhizobium ruizarguesonis]
MVFFDFGRVVLRVDDAADRLGLLDLLALDAHSWASLRPSPTVTNRSRFPRLCVKLWSQHQILQNNPWLECSPPSAPQKPRGVLWAFRSDFLSLLSGMKSPRHSRRRACQWFRLQQLS